MNLTVSMAYQKVLDAPLKYRLLANFFTQVLLSYTKYLKSIGIQSYGFQLSNTSLFAMLYIFFTFLLRSPKKKFDFQNLQISVKTMFYLRLISHCVSCFLFERVLKFLNS